LPNSEHSDIIDPGRRGVFGVNLTSERGTTQTIVKVPKYLLSVNGTKASIIIDREEVGSEAATL
jgi:hypothetical protein